MSARLADEKAKPEPSAALLSQLDRQCVDMTKEQLALNPDDEMGMEMTRRRYQGNVFMKAKIFFLLATALVIAGCGRGNSNETNSALGLSKTQPVSASTTAKQFSPTGASASSSSAR